MLVVEMTGRIGHASADALSAALYAAFGNGQRKVVLDFENVDYISSAGLAVLEAASSHLAEIGGALVLCGVSQPVRIALDLAGYLRGCAIEASREQATARATAASGRRLT